jgi:hypothetical protein
MFEQASSLGAHFQKIATRLGVDVADFLPPERAIDHAINNYQASLLHNADNEDVKRQLEDLRRR